MLELERPNRAGWIGFTILLVAASGSSLLPVARASSVWSESSNKGAQVVLDEKRHSVTLSIDRDRARVAQAVNITLFHADGGRLDLKLKTSDPKEARTGNMVRFTGTFVPESTPFVGFEIRIPLEDTPSTVLRSVDMRRQ